MLAANVVLATAWSLVAVAMSICTFGHEPPAHVPVVALAR